MTTTVRRSSHGAYRLVASSCSCARAQAPASLRCRCPARPGWAEQTPADPARASRRRVRPAFPSRGSSDLAGEEGHAVGVLAVRVNSPGPPSNTLVSVTDAAGASGVEYRTSPSVKDSVAAAPPWHSGHASVTRCVAPVRVVGSTPGRTTVSRSFALGLVGDQLDQCRRIAVDQHCVIARLLAARRAPR